MNLNMPRTPASCGKFGPEVRFFTSRVLLSGQVKTLISLYSQVAKLMGMGCVTLIRVVEILPFGLGNIMEAPGHVNAGLP